MNEIHEANRRGWDAVSPGWQAGIDRRGVWPRAHREPELVLHERERAWLGDVAGREVCVLGSGDNVVVFALAGLGARVTSVDISQVQLDTAARRAAKLELDVRFLRADVTDLRELPDAAFDVAYTGGHVAVWVSDLPRYYAEAARILRPGGLFVVTEYHPFRRLWRYGTETLEREVGYFERGPFVDDRSHCVEGAAPGTYLGYEFHWTVGDYVSAVLAAGCEVLALEEFGDDREDWEEAPFEGLPRCLMVVGRKR